MTVFLTTLNQMAYLLLLIVIGFLNTVVMAVEGDALIFHKCIDLGGGHIAADLSEGLDISFRNAEEKIKQRPSVVYSATCASVCRAMAATRGLLSE